MISLSSSVFCQPAAGGRRKKRERERERVTRDQNRKEQHPMNARSMMKKKARIKFHEFSPLLIGLYDRAI